MKLFNFKVKRFVPVVTAVALAASLTTPAHAATATFATISKTPSSSVPADTAVTDTFAMTGITTGVSVQCANITYGTALDTAGNPTGTISGFSTSAVGLTGSSNTSFGTPTAITAPTSSSTRRGTDSS